jgi:hypothetical protein
LAFGAGIFLLAHEIGSLTTGHINVQSQQDGISGDSSSLLLSRSQIQ